MSMSRDCKRTNNRAVIYGRPSLRKRPDGSESCDKQIEVCQRYCDLHKLEVIGVYYDKDRSGDKAADRPGLQLALHKAVKNQAVLVVHSLSRLALTTKGTIKIIKRLEHAKADLCSVSEEIDTTKDYGWDFFKTVSLFVKIEHDLVSERTSQTMLRQQREGRRMSFLPPYGMMNNPKDPTRLKVNFDEQRVIIRMVELHKAGLSFRAIGRQLTKEGMKPRKVRIEFNGRNVLVNGRWRNDLIARAIRRKKDSMKFKPSDRHKTPPVKSSALGSTSLSG